jgi:hypothetical protein
MVATITAVRKRTSARVAWLARYRALRKADRLWSFMLLKNGWKADGLPSFMHSTPGWDDFDFTRLRGDHLGMCGRHIGRVQHVARMNYLRQRVRLP